MAKLIYCFVIAVTQLVCCLQVQARNTYFADWGVLGGDRQPTCVTIPSNMSLCHNIGYNKMRLPNLLEHDSLQEASQQAASWIPLLNLKCHGDSQLFLCSLFAPVCLERPIYPCRSLCHKVKSGCEETMTTYGFPWPSMLDCDKFPLDNDMCIASLSDKEDEDDKSKCRARTCNQASTYENILANFCQADFVVKMKFNRIRRLNLKGNKVNTVYKTWRGTPLELRKLRKPTLNLDDASECCSEWLHDQPKKQRYLVMGKKQGDDLVPTFILPWTKSKEMKKARRMFKQIDCSNLRETSQKMMAENYAPQFTNHNVNMEARKRRRTKRSSES